MNAENPRTEAERLGQAIQIRRAELQIKRPQLARQAELSYPYVSEIENGAKLPSAKALSQLAQALGLSPSELMQRAETLDGPAREEDSSPAMFMTPEALFETGPRQQVLGRTSSRPMLQARGGAPRRATPPPTQADRGLEDLIAAIVRAEVRAELSAWANQQLPALIESEVQRVLTDLGFVER